MGVLTGEGPCAVLLIAQSFNSTRNSRCDRRTLVSNTKYNMSCTCVCMCVCVFVCVFVVCVCVFVWCVHVCVGGEMRKHNRDTSHTLSARQVPWQPINSPGRTPC